MEDIFLEQMVVKKNTKKDILLKVLIILIGGYLVTFFFAAAMLLAQSAFLQIALLFVAGTVWLAIKLFKNLYTEYEYIVTNGELDIDKISGKSKRKRLLTVKFAHFESFDKYSPEDTTSTEITKIIAAQSLEADNTYSAKFNHSKLGKCVLVFSPDERILKEISRYKRLAKNIEQKAAVGDGDEIE